MEDARLSRLTPRERDVLALIARGLSNDAVADHLHVSLKTVEAACASIFRKLDLAETPGANRRVRAALIYHDATGAEPGPPLGPAPSASSESPYGTSQLDGVIRPGAAHQFLVGRERQLADVDVWIDAAIAGRGHMVLVTGEGGIGKTALVREVVGRAARTGMEVVSGHVWEEEGAPPFWPWTEILQVLSDRSAAASPDGPTSTQARSHDTFERRPTSGPSDVVERLRFFESLRAELVSAAAARPLLIVIEDIHAADVDSLHLLRFVARAVEASPMLLIATQRPLLPSAVGTSRARVLADLLRDGTTSQLALPRLTSTQAAQLLELHLGRPLPVPVSTAICGRAEGLPFFLTEMARLLVTRSIDVDGVVAEDLSLPESVQHMVTSRLGSLTESAAEILTIASVVGRDVPLRVIQAIGVGEPESVAVALESAKAVRLVTDLATSAPGYRFEHIILRDALYQSIPPISRRRLHERVADILEAGGAGPVVEHVNEIAQHRLATLDGTNAEVVIAALRRAARHAVDHLAFDAGAQLYELAAATIRRFAADDTLLARVLIDLGDAQQRSGDTAPARENLLVSADIARRSGDTDLLADVALRLGRGFEAQMFDGQLVALLEESLAALPHDRVALRARLTARLAMATYFEVAGQRREELSAEALRLASATRKATVVAEALGARYFALWGPGHADERADLGARMLQLATDTKDDAIALDALTWIAMEELERGRRGAFDAAAARHARLAERCRDPLHGYYADMWRGMVAALEGRYPDAEAAAATALERGRPLTELARPRFSALLIGIRREQDRLREIGDIADQIVVSYPLLRLGWEPLRALIHAELGDPEPARRLLDGVASSSPTTPRDANWTSAMIFLTDACQLVGAPDHARALYGRLAAYADRCAIVRFAPVCWGSVARSLGVLAAVYEDDATAIRHLDTAIAQNERLGAPTWTARAQDDLAAVLLRGDTTARHRAGALLASAAMTADQLGMVRLRRLIDHLDRP